MRIAITLLLIVLMGTSHAQQPALRSALGGKPAVAATVDVAEERAKLETQLGETLRQREAELPGARETASADSVRAADRQRLLDHLAFLQGERIKRLDELGALQKAPPFTLASLPVVHAIGATPPYSALAVDALRMNWPACRTRFRHWIPGSRLANRKSRSWSNNCGGPMRHFAWQLID